MVQSGRENERRFNVIFPILNLETKEEICFFVKVDHFCASFTFLNRSSNSQSTGRNTLGADDGLLRDRLDLREDDGGSGISCSNPRCRRSMSTHFPKASSLSQFQITAFLRSPNGLDQKVEALRL